MTDEAQHPDEDEASRIGIFPSWRSLYLTVVVYTLALVALLYLFTVALDHGSP